MVFNDGDRRSGRGRRRNGTAPSAHVGLTDGTPEASRNGSDADETQPWSPWSMVRNARSTWTGFQRVLRLVWEASAFLTIALASLNLAQGLLPAARVWLSKLLIDAVVAAVSTGVGTAALPQVAVL